LLEQLKRAAPSVDIEMRRVAGRAEEDLRTGRIDLYLGVWPNIPSSLERHLLRQETFACIARKGHPVIKSRLTLEDFVSVGHVLVAPSGRPGSVIDTALSDQGLGRRVVLRTPHFSIAPLVVARSDLIATLPRAVATAFAEVLPLRVYPPPLDAPGFPVHMVWHPRTHEQPPHRWMRQVLMDLAHEAW
jgi:DNA-binding transcriptional LysR family regulator